MNKSLKSIERSFSISTSNLRQIIKDFHHEMERGLAGKPSSLKMIPTYVDRPTGRERGVFLALDLGGTNFRILELELKGSGRVSAPRIMKFALGKGLITGAGENFFDFLAKCLRRFLKKHKIDDKEERRLGFTFSFPVRQRGAASGTLVCWTKGFDAKGVIGKDVVRLLEEALERNGLSDIKVTALLNDTVATLAAKSYEDADCDVGVILGTGTNACYLEEISNIKKCAGPSIGSGWMIINIEWGNFNKLPLTIYDKTLDRLSANPGEQVLEKMVSGMYLGEVARLVMKDLIGGPMFSKPQSLKTEDMSAVETDSSSALTPLRKICGIVSTRAARISAAAIAAVVTKMDPDISRRHTVAIDGSVYERYPGFSNNMKRALKELFAGKAPKIKMALAKDASGIGAAVIAATEK